MVPISHVIINGDLCHNSHSAVTAHNTTMSMIKAEQWDTVDKKLSFCNFGDDVTKQSNVSTICLPQIDLGTGEYPLTTSAHHNSGTNSTKCDQELT